MRLARVQDFRRRLRERAADWPFKLTLFSYADIPSLGTGEIPLLSPLVIFAGPNGVGKTTLLRALWAAAAGAEAITTGSVSLKLSSGAAKLRFIQGEQTNSVEVRFAGEKVDGGGGLPFDVIHIDTSMDVKGHQADFCKFKNVEDLINGVGGKVMDANALAEINYVSRRQYRDIKLYEVERGDGVVPFFEVSYENDRYDSRTMGAGELAVLYLWWALDRAPDSAVVLIEEPETYLSPASQEALSDYLVTACVEKRLNVIVTSHSPKIIGNVPDEQLVFLFRKGSTVKTVEGWPPPALLATIGITDHVNVIALVEDKAAAHLLHHTLERLKPRLSRRIEISIRNGDGNITSLLAKVGGVFEHIKIIGVLDGDLRGKVPEETARMCAFLPGDKPIETIFRELVEADPNSLATSTGSGDIAVILFGLQGADHHDWYAGLCKQLGLTKDQLFPMLFQIWEKKAGSTEAMHKLVDDLTALLTPE